MSGAGKATALAALARAGADVHDNLPLALVSSWTALPRHRTAVAVIDARQGPALREVVSFPGTSVLFLDASDSVLLRRLGESTAPHPVATGPAGITRERELLTAMRAAADTVIDTSELDAEGLATRVRGAVLGADGQRPVRVRVTIASFGYKFGPATEADWVFDVRILRNPFWDAHLRSHTGREPEVRRYIFDDPSAGELCNRVSSLLHWVVERYAAHDRRHLHVAFGCTGGRHRSVAVAEEMAERLGADGLDVSVLHRDVDKPDLR